MAVIFDVGPNLPGSIRPPRDGLLRFLSEADVEQAAKTKASSMIVAARADVRKRVDLGPSNWRDTLRRA
jgi:hypothetical protein